MAGLIKKAQLNWRDELLPKQPTTSYFLPIVVYEDERLRLLWDGLPSLRSWLFTAEISL
jgi:hypothetical protein